MEKMLVVVFENEKKAFEGTQALANFDFEGSIAVHAQAVIQKNQDGTISMKQAEDDFPVRTVGGTAIGSLIHLSRYCGRSNQENWNGEQKRE